MKVKGFKPIFNSESEILILGSFPSVKSRQTDFYYGNKQNGFWKVLSKVYNVPLLEVDAKTECLLSNNIALWDIVAECEIDGSMDKDVKNPKFANLKKVLPPNTKVKKILCNGKLSYNLTCEYLQKFNINIPCICMPSTSPANVRFNEQVWISQLLDN